MLNLSYNATIELISDCQYLNIGERNQEILNNIKFNRYTYTIILQIGVVKKDVNHVSWLAP